MLTIRRADDRGHANHGWLDSHHTFSFASYYDPAHMGYRDLRVINDDRVAGGGGFPPHPHRDFEIISYVLDGALAHRDSMGHGTTVSAGEVQRITAGTGITHAEYNASETEPVHFLQIWIQPEREGLEPGYEQRAFPPEDRRGELALIASPDGRDDSLTIRQDVRLYSAALGAGDAVEHALAPDRYAWVHVARGAVTLNGQALAAGDGAAVSDEAALRLTADGPAEVLVFDLC